MNDEENLNENQDSTLRIANNSTFEKINSFSNKNNEIIIGSVEKCNYNCKDPTLSKIHAIFKKNDKEKYVIIDNESTNG